MGPARPRLQDGHRPLDRPRGIRPPVTHHRPSHERFARPLFFRPPGSPQLNAAPADQIRLLDVQALDARLQQLEHRRRTLPEHAEIESLTKDHIQLRDLLVAAQTEESDTAREQIKAEQDVDQVRQRATRDQQRLDSGAVSSPKDLENLQREITSLAKRQGDLEDIVLEVMERRESAQERVAELTERVGAVQGKVDDATARRDAAFEEIDSEVARVTKEREVISAAVPADLLKLYDKLRDQQGGVGAAKLYQRTCQGCRQELSITDFNDIRKASPDTVVRCENCGRILVRTAESGL
jgi:predicted  nucleic acid-binding Zn-ribbon protein